MTTTDAQAAISFYHDLCTPQRIADACAVLASDTRAPHLAFGSRPLCTALRPQFLTIAEWRYIRQVSALLASAFDKVHRAALSNAALRAQLWITPQEESLVSLATGYEAQTPMGRLDAFFSRAGSSHEPPGLQLVEYNTESPAAIAYEDVLTELFLETPLMRAFAGRFRIQPLWVRPLALQTMLRGYRQWGGRDLPHIAIVDWRETPTSGEFWLFQDYFAQHGIQAVIVDPHEMTYERGALYADGAPVDFVYKRVLTSELLGRFGLDHAIIHAVREGAVCMMNPFSGKLLHKKASLALVSDEANASLFSAAELAAIRQHIPWTRRVQAGYADYRGQRVDLFEFIAEQQERLVLKPNDDYGGKGVIIGWETAATDWRQAVVEALEEPYVVQERAPITQETFPALMPDNSVQFRQRLLDCDPYVFDGYDINGCLTRLSTTTVLNVTAGGGSLVPTFVIDERQ